MESPLEELSLSQLPLTLLDLVTNSLVWHQLAPYIPLPSKLALASTCKTYKAVIEQDSESFRYLDLSHIHGARLDDVSTIDSGGINWRCQRMDEGLTEDEFYCGPLRGIFSALQKRGILRRVHTMILDGLSVPADLVQEIMTEDRFNVRILSIRDATHLNERKLMQLLKYICRPSRPEGTPQVKGIYVFGKAESYSLDKKIHPNTGNASLSGSGGGVMTSEGAQIGAEWNHKSQDALTQALNLCEDKWYQPSGRIVRRMNSEWGSVLQACEGILFFDATLCRGPRHDINTLARQTPDTPSSDAWLESAVASVALGPAGCVKCNSCSEGPAVYGQSPDTHLPLLSPPPMHSSSIRNAQLPSVRCGTTYPPLYARCEDCLRGRWCERCFKWWDEACYTSPGSRSTEVSDGIFEQYGTIPPGDANIKVHMGLCTQTCLVSEMFASGSSAMWG